MTLQQIWQRITTTRYTRALEIEVARLRAENRALLNSILGIAGVPPLPTDAPPLASIGASLSGPHANREQNPPARIPLRKIRADSTSPQSESSVSANAIGGVGANAAIPMRRRSWHQINRILEFESAKKKESEMSS